VVRDRQHAAAIGGAAVNRATVLVTVAAAIAGGMLADRIARPPADGDSAVALAAQMPTAAPERALSSTWFCAGGTGTPSGRADATVIVANPTRRDLDGTLTVTPATGEAKSVPLTVPARSRTITRLGDVVAADFVAATVDLDGGGAVVEHQVTGPLGTSVAPCAATGSSRWYVADGSTARDDTMLLALYNPFPEDAIVDLSFSTDEGRAVPAGFQGLVVRGGGLGIVDVGLHVRRRDRVAATVEARSGRLVVDRIQLRAGGTPRSLSLALAAPSPGERWWFADGLVADGVVERFSIYNPTAEEAAVSLDIVADAVGSSGDAAAQVSVEPFDLTVPPRQRIDLVANDEERVPKGVAHAASVTSLNGVPVVVERSINASPPAGRLGISEELGARRLASRWVLAAGAATDTVDEWLSVLNPTTSDVRVSVTVLASGQPLPVESLQDVPVAAGRRVTFRLTDHIKRDDLALLVEAEGGEVVVGRALYAVGSPGLSLTAGIPLR
jgi:hypothetical protein